MAEHCRVCDGLGNEASGRAERLLPACFPARWILERMRLSADGKEMFRPRLTCMQRDQPCHQGSKAPETVACRPRDVHSRDRRPASWSAFPRPKSLGGFARVLGEPGASHARRERAALCIDPRRRHFAGTHGRLDALHARYTSQASVRPWSIQLACACRKNSIPTELGCQLAVQQPASRGDTHTHRQAHTHTARAGTRWGTRRSWVGRRQ